MMFLAHPHIHIYTHKLMKNHILTVHIILIGLVGFYGLSTIVGCPMTNPVFTYILNIDNL